MNKIVINRTVVRIEIQDETQSEHYWMDSDEEYHQFLRAINRRNSSALTEEIFLHLRGKGLLNIEKLAKF